MFSLISSKTFFMVDPRAKSGKMFVKFGIYFIVASSSFGIDPRAELANESLGIPVFDSSSLMLIVELLVIWADSFYFWSSSRKLELSL